MNEKEYPTRRPELLRVRVASTKGKTGWVSIFLNECCRFLYDASRNYFDCAFLTLLYFTLYVK